MSLEQTTELYASVLRQLLPESVYDTAISTNVTDDVYAHAKVLAQADIDAHRLLRVLEEIPTDLLADYEREYGLPMQCMVPGTTIEERINVLKWIRTSRNVMNREYLEQLLAIFGVSLLQIQKYKPTQCTATCLDAINTERSRFKVILEHEHNNSADLSCIIEHYLPSYLSIEMLSAVPDVQWTVSSFEIIDDTILFFANKIQELEFVTWSEFNLITAIVRSFKNEQSHQAIDTAVRALNSNKSWTFDFINSRIVTNNLGLLSYLTFEQIATQIILHSRSSNSSIFENSNAYINLVGASIFESTESLNYVKISDLNSKFNSNKKPLGTSFNAVNLNFTGRLTNKNINWEIVQNVAKQHIYLSNSNITENSLPDPIVVLGTVRNYPLNLQYSSSYYVRIGTFIDDNETLSEEIHIQMGTPWTAENLSLKPKLWFNYEHVTVDSSNRISQLNAVGSTSVIATQSTNANKPILRANAIEFDGVDDVLNISALNLFQNVNKAWVLVVLKRNYRDLVDTERPVFGWSAGSRTTYRFALIAGNTGERNKIYMTGRRTDTELFKNVRCNFELEVDNYYITFGYIDYSNNSMSLYVNSELTEEITNAFLEAGNTANTISTHATFGGRIDSSTYLKGSIKEILIGNTTITVKDRQRMEGWLAWKYNLESNLATDHPYRLKFPSLEEGE